MGTFLSLLLFPAIHPSLTENTFPSYWPGQCRKPLSLLLALWRPHLLATESDDLAWGVALAQPSGCSCQCWSELRALALPSHPKSFLCHLATGHGVPQRQMRSPGTWDLGPTWTDRTQTLRVAVYRTPKSVLCRELPRDQDWWCHWGGGRAVTPHSHSMPASCSRWWYPPACRFLRYFLLRSGTPFQTKGGQGEVSLRHLQSPHRYRGSCPGTEQGPPCGGTEGLRRHKSEGSRSQCGKHRAVKILGPFDV